MAEKLDPRQVVTFEELLRAMMIEQDATRRVLVRKGLLTNEEVLEEGIQCRSPCWKDKGIGRIKSPVLSHNQGSADLQESPFRGPRHRSRRKNTR